MLSWCGAVVKAIVMNRRVVVRIAKYLHACAESPRNTALRSGWLLPSPSSSSSRSYLLRVCGVTLERRELRLLR